MNYCIFSIFSLLVWHAFCSMRSIPLEWAEKENGSTMHIDPAQNSTASNYYQTTHPASSAQKAPGATTDFAHMTISQIRDMTDKMAAEGKLDKIQEIALAGAGLMDGGNGLPSAPDDGVAFSRSDPGTYNMVGLMDNAAIYSAYMGDPGLGDVFQSVAHSVQTYEGTEGAATPSIDHKA